MAIEDVGAVDAELRIVDPRMKSDLTKRGPIAVGVTDDREVALALPDLFIGAALSVDEATALRDLLTRAIDRAR